MDADAVTKDMFDNQDQNKDGRITEDELTLKEEKESEVARRDEL